MHCLQACFPGCPRNVLFTSLISSCSFNDLRLCSLHTDEFIMDPSKSRKPSLPRLTTNIPAERQANVSLPLAPKNHPDANVQKPATGPKLFMDDTKDDENAFPTLRYAPDPKPFYVAPKNIEDSPVNKRMAVYYDELLSFRGPSNSPQERVAQDSVVVAELKTSHKVRLVPLAVLPSALLCTNSCPGQSWRAQACRRSSLSPRSDLPAP